MIPLKIEHPSTQTMIKTLAALLLLATSLPLCAQDTNSVHSWTSSDGRVIQAKFVRMEANAVVIEKDGKEFTLPFSKLNEASVSQAKLLGKPPPPKAQTGPLKPEPLASKPPPPVVEPKVNTWIVKGVSEVSRKVFTTSFANRESGLDRDFTQEGDLVLPIFTFDTSTFEASTSLVRISGESGKVLWQVPPERIPGTEFKLLPSADSVVLIQNTEQYYSAAIKDKLCPGSDVAVTCVSLQDGSVRWRRTYDGPQKGHNIAKGALLDAAGNIIVGVESSGPRVPTKTRAGSEEILESPRETMDAIIVRFSSKDGQVLSEGKGLAVPGKGDGIDGMAMAPDGRLMIFRGKPREPDMPHMKNLACYDVARDTVAWESELGDILRECNVCPWVDAAGVLVTPNRATTHRLVGNDDSLLTSVNFSPAGRRLMDLTFPDLKEDFLQPATLLGKTSFVISGSLRTDQTLQLRCHDRTNGDLLWKWANLLQPVSQMGSRYDHTLVSDGRDALFFAWVQPGPSAFQLAMAKFDLRGQLLWTRVVADQAVPPPAGWVFNARLDPVGNPILVHDQFEGSVDPKDRFSRGWFPKVFERRSVWTLTKIDRTTGLPLWQSTRSRRIALSKAGYLTSVATDASGNVFHLWAPEDTIKDRSEHLALPTGFRITKHAAKDGRILWETMLQL